MKGTGPGQAKGSRKKKRGLGNLGREKWGGEPSHPLLSPHSEIAGPGWNKEKGKNKKWASNDCVSCRAREEGRKGEWGGQEQKKWGKKKNCQTSKP